MIIFKILLIFLSILISKTDGFHILYNRYFIGITGSIYCRYAPTGHGYVFISTNPRANHENHPIFQKEVKYGEPFFITVRPRGTRKTSRCMRPNLINYRSKMIRKYVEEIPTQRISKIGRPTSLYHRGKIDLARLR